MKGVGVVTCIARTGAKTEHCWLGWCVPNINHGINIHPSTGSASPNTGDDVLRHRCDAVSADIGLARSVQLWPIEDDLVAASRKFPTNVHWGATVSVHIHRVARG